MFRPSRSVRSAHRRLAAVLVAILASSALAPLASAQSMDEAGASPVPRIEVAFVLDTTGSMAGLIEGAKAKIWEIANLIVSAEPTPDVRIGLIAYRDRGDAYVTQLTDLTGDIDAIYAQLQGFRADGGGDGPESVNQALNEAVTRLGWTPFDPAENQIARMIFLVGDAPPHLDYAGDVHYRESVTQALARGITVNTVQCGMDSYTTTIWREIATAGDGGYAAIEQSGGVAVIETPFDAELARLNAAIGGTLVPYGDAGGRLADYQAASETAAPAATADRLSFNRALGQVAGGGGDLVDAVNNGEVELETVSDDALPEAMRAMGPEERAAYLQQQTAERAQLQEQVDALLVQRDAFLQAEQERRREAGELTGFDAEVDGMIRAEAAEAGIALE